jgi:hypothetical protein
MGLYKHVKLQIIKKETCKLIVLTRKATVRKAVPWYKRTATKMMAELLLLLLNRTASISRRLGYQLAAPFNIAFR